LAVAAAKGTEAVDEELMFEPIPSRRAFETVCERIRAQVASGDLRPGDKLPPERQLAEQLNVSRLVIREAFRSLENAGVVVLQRGPKGGAFIQGGSDTKLTELMQDMLHLGRIPLSDLTEARIYFLDSVVRLACERATQADLDALVENVRMNEALFESGDREKRITHAMEFYSQLAAATRNTVMMMVVNSFTDILLTVLRSVEVYPSVKLTASRRRFMAQLLERNADKAAAELGAHLRNVHEHIVKHMEEASERRKAGAAAQTENTAA
jgi:GntR family transcriptional repressor for pyruvate dehydrogenase complex